MEEVCLAFDHSLLKDQEARGNAESFIEEQINENADFYQILFNIFNSSTNAKHKKQSLIYMKIIILDNFKFIKNSLQQFSEQLYEIISNSQDSEFFELEVQIALKTALLISLEIKEPWSLLEQLIVLYRENENFFSFCIYLYFFCFNDLNISKYYKKFFREIECEITLLGLKHDNAEVIIASASHIITCILNSNDESVLKQYEEHYAIIFELAENSDCLDEDDFILFWSKIKKIPINHIEKFFDLAISLLSKNEKLNENQKMALLRVLIKNWPIIKERHQKNLEDFINLYFELQSNIEDIDYDPSIFSNFSKIDFNESYEPFMNNIQEFLKDGNEIIQFKGLVMLREFTRVFFSKFNSEISQFINLSLTIIEKTVEHFDWAAAFICEYLEHNKLSYKNEEILHGLAYKCIINSQEEIISYDSYLICKKLEPNPIYFDEFIEAFMSNKIQLEKVPFVLCLLVNLYSPENNLTNEKYEPFIGALCDLINEHSKEFQEIYNEFNEFNEFLKKIKKKTEEEEEEEEYEKLIRDKLYQSAVHLISISNILLLFSLSNPNKYSENIKSAIQCFIDFSLNDEVREIGKKNTANIIPDIKNNFTQIFKINKIIMIEYLKYQYEQISKIEDIEKLNHILIECEGDNFVATNKYVENFVVTYEKNEGYSNMEINQFIIDDLYFTILPISKWLYRIQDDEIQNKFIKTLYFYVKISGRSYELFIYSTKILKRLAKPERINSEKYNQMCSGFNKMMTDFSERSIPKIQPMTYCQCFEGLVNLMIFFIRMKNEYAHTFLVKYIFPFYEEHRETSEIDLLILFTKMIDLKFYNPNEIDAMKQVIDNIIERGKIYLDVRPYLFNLIAKITKIEQENASKYFQFGLETFEKVKEKPIYYKVKAYCAFFLLTCFNQDSEQFKEVINLLPNIFSVFPTINIINDLFEEIKIFIDKNKNSFTKEVYELLISTLTRYLSYQENAPLVFKFNIDFHNELIEIFGKLLEVYFNKFEPGSFEELLQECLPEQPSSVQYILSLQKQ